MFYVLQIDYVGVPKKAVLFALTLYKELTSYETIVILLWKATHMYIALRFSNVPYFVHYEYLKSTLFYTSEKSSFYENC